MAIFLTPHVSHLDRLGGHILGYTWLGYTTHTSMFTMKNRNLGGGGVLQDPVWHQDYIQLYGEMFTKRLMASFTTLSNKINQVLVSK